MRSNSPLTKVQRVLSAVAASHPEKLEETIAIMYHLSFVERQEVTTSETLILILGKIFGESEAKDILAKVCGRILQYINRLGLLKFIGYK